MAFPTLEDLHKLAVDVDRAKSYDVLLLRRLEEAADWLFPEATMNKSTALEIVPDLTVKLLRLIAKSSRVKELRNDRDRLVKLLWDSVRRHSEIPVLSITNLMNIFRECNEKHMRTRTYLLEVSIKSLLSYGSIKHECEKAKEALDVLNMLLQGATRELRSTLRERFPKETKSLVNYLINCGDYSVQEVVAETLTRLAPGDVREKLVDRWFGDFPKEAKEAFINFGKVHFEVELQTFLNPINSKFCTQVHPFVCSRLVFNGDKMYKSEFQEKLYIHFSLGTKMISFLAVLKKEPVDEERNPLRRIEISVSSVKEVAWIGTAKYEMYKALSFKFEATPGQEVHVLMMLREVDDDTMIYLFGDKLKFKKGDITAEMMRLSQTLLDQTKTPMLTQHEDHDASRYMIKDRADSPTWTENYSQSSSWWVPSEPSAPTEEKVKSVKRQATPVNAKLPPRDHSPGKSTYADYMTVADSDETLNEFLEAEESGAVEELQATPVAEKVAQKVAATPAVLSKPKVHFAGHTPANVNSNLMATPAESQEAETRSDNETPAVVARRISTPAPLPKPNISAVIPTPAASGAIPKRQSTPAPNKADDLSDEEENERPAIRRNATPAGKPKVPRQSLNAPSVEPASEMEEIPLSLRVPAKKKAASKPRARKPPAKPKKAAQPRTRKPPLRNRSPKDESKYSKLDVEIKSPQETAMDVDQQLHVNAPVKRKVPQKAKAEEEDPLMDKRLKVATAEQQKTYSRKPVFPKFNAAASFRSRDSVFDELVNSVSAPDIKPVQFVTPQRPKSEEVAEVPAEPQLFEDIDFSGVEVRQSSLNAEPTSGAKKKKLSVPNQNKRQTKGRNPAPKRPVRTSQVTHHGDQEEEQVSNNEKESCANQERGASKKKLEPSFLSSEQVQMELDESDDDDVVVLDPPKPSKPRNEKPLVKDDVAKVVRTKRVRQSKLDMAGDYRFDGLFRPDDASDEDEFPAPNLDSPEVAEGGMTADKKSKTPQAKKPVSEDSFASMFKMLNLESEEAMEREIEENRKKMVRRLENLYATYTREETPKDLRVKLVLEMRAELKKAMEEEKKRQEEYDNVISLATNIKAGMESLLAAQEASQEPDRRDRVLRLKKLGADLKQATTSALAEDKAKIEAEREKIVEEANTGLAQIIKNQMQKIATQIQSVFTTAKK